METTELVAWYLLVLGSDGWEELYFCLLSDYPAAYLTLL